MKGPCDSAGPPTDPCLEGQARWVAERAQWLQVLEEEVAQLPSSFEDDGTLRPLLLERHLRSGGPVDLEAWERTSLEASLQETAHPYTELRRPVPLPLVISTAAKSWGQS
uniref:Uncharacterized protein n=1 Tax=Noctiluca scintillans TaxID=2966 RepID=A0A7S1AJG2_NOCSC|mmetsp:Transcript_48782/g.129303  ORF Transcript_48782/g.129303 Transcript_48782/m.129303 type:complete len:110 (+) Transcript_48782:100-429(+)